jgi:hypothetical protein
MKKHLTSLLLSLITISLVGCSSMGGSREPRQIPEVKVITEEVSTTIYHPPLPQEVRLEDMRWMVLTKDNIDEQIVEAEKLLGGEFVVFAMIPTDYENFAWNIQELRRFIRQQKEIILYYRDATGAGQNDEKEEWLEKNSMLQAEQDSDIAEENAEAQEDIEELQADTPSFIEKVGDLIPNPLKDN